jgi:hypothetical protein
MFKQVAKLSKVDFDFVNYAVKDAKYVVTDFINALPGNSSVNTVQHATIYEAVFPTTPAPCSLLVTDQ